MKSKKTYIILLCLFFVLGCSGIGYLFAKGEIRNPPTAQSTILILGLELDGFNLSSARVQMNMNGRIAEGVGQLRKGNNPDNSQSKNVSSRSIDVYTGDKNRGYLVFELPANLNERKLKDFLIYVYGVSFSEVKSVSPSDLSPGDIHATSKSGQTGWWRLYTYEFFGKPSFRNNHPLGFKEDPNWGFYGCKFTVEKPGIYYLSEFRIYANLTVGERTSDGNLATNKVVVDKRLHTAAVDGIISGYSDIQDFQEFLKFNKIDVDTFIDYSKYCRKISLDEYLNFGK